MPKKFHGEVYGAFIERLVAARRGAGMTQIELAVRLGRHQSFVSNFESRIRRLDIVEALVIAKIIGIDPVVLMTELNALVESDTII
jgi:transcriptional regulator with XRE-family HTH domain